MNGLGTITQKNRDAEARERLRISIQHVESLLVWESDPCNLMFEVFDSETRTALQHVLAVARQGGKNGAR